MKNKPVIVIPGFKFASVSAGIKPSKNLDMSLIFSEQKCVAAGLFTTNKVIAAPVILCKRHLKKGKKPQAILINSGNANAATGLTGQKNALQMAQQISAKLNLKTEDVFVCSTGKIGAPLPMNKINEGIKSLPNNLHEKGFHLAHQGILTTDAYPKFSHKKIKLGSKTVSFALMAKGAGMIEPNMATMLAFLVSDLKISKALWQTLIKEAVSQTFNSLSVDGDMSTNDTILALANGVAKNEAIKVNSKERILISKALKDMMTEVCLQIARDGEGSSKAITLEVKNAKNQKEAKLAARAISNSLLVKTALFGGDPNWGRILCAAGYSGANLIEKKTSIFIGKTAVFLNGKPLPKNETQAAKYLKTNDKVFITITLGAGHFAQQQIFSDLGYEYVRINAEYRT